MSRAGDSLQTERRKGKLYGFRSFAVPGSAIDVGGPFRDNIRLLLAECADLEDYNVEGMPVWSTLLVDENTGVVVPLYTVEEAVAHTTRPFCDHCRCTGWSHHFVSTRRYHLIIPADCNWDRPLSGKIYDVQSHILHGLIHCNGFGHLLCINGREGGSEFIRGTDVMDLFDRICNTLRTREISLEDTSKKQTMELRLLHAVAYGQSWFARWGYRFGHGSFGIMEEKYLRAIDILTSAHLGSIIDDLGAVGHDRDMRKLIGVYQKESDSRLVTLQDLLGCMLRLKSRLPLHKPGAVFISPPVMKIQRRPESSTSKSNRVFSALAAELESRWPVRRLERAADVIVRALRENRTGGGMTRQELRDAARLQIGDTGLLDFVLKWLGNCIVGEYVVRRSVNQTTRVLQFTLERLTRCPKTGVTDADVGPMCSEKEQTAAAVPRSRNQVYRDIFFVYQNVLENYPETSTDILFPRAVQVLLDSKHFIRCWPFTDDDDAMLRFLCRVAPSAIEMEELPRGMPANELVVVPAYSTIGDLTLAGQEAMRDTYCVMEKFVARGLKGVEGTNRDVLFGVLESGSQLWLTGEGIDTKHDLKYEGGADDWMVDCPCGASDDDGERMVCCDICEVWQHTRCGGIDDGDAVPQLFMCDRCQVRLMPPGSRFRVSSEPA